MLDVWENAIRVLSVLGALGLPTTVVVAITMRGKIRAEAKKTGADTASVLTGSAMEMVNDIRADLVETQREVRALRRHVGVLEGLLRVNGVPIPELAWPPAV